uniref:G protein gamma domain-containing protein n=1 Tax=Zonotrichia albicollis TaxID=44394 RepID=A0A8D2M578_ZONAL
VQEWEWGPLQSSESFNPQLPPGRARPGSALCRFVKWIEDGIPEDPFLNPELMKNNPWVEKGKCIIL